MKDDVEAGGGARMGCLGEEERKEILEGFWEAQERSRGVFVRHLRRVRRAASLEEDPYRKRLLSWAAENWQAIETLGWEGSPGLYGTAYAALPEDLRADMDEGRASVDLDRVLNAEDRERLGLQELLYEERERTGSPCPETGAKLEEINERRRARGEHLTTPDRIKELHREIAQASRVHDPADLPG